MKREKSPLRTLSLLILLTFLPVIAWAWENPFQAAQDAAREGVAGNLDEDEPDYNLTLGSLFGIYVEPGIDPIDEFERKPFIYISKTQDDEYGVSNGITRKIRLKILHRSTYYPNGKLEFPCQLLVCEWKRRLSPGSYDLWVQPRNYGDYYEPCRVTGSFTLEKPIIQKAELVDGENDMLIYVKVTGLYFSITPRVYVFYAVVKDGNVIKIKQKCRLESKTIDRVTGASEAVFSFKKRANTSWALADENGEPLVEIKNGTGRKRSNSLAGTFDSIDVGNHSSPAFGDLDGDGDLDLMVGEGTNGKIHYFENSGSAMVPAYTEKTGGDSPVNGFKPGRYLAAPFLADLDNDGDLDLLSGSCQAGEISYWENTGNASVPAFTAQTSTANPFNGIIDYNTNSSLIHPELADIDNDGDLDLMYTNERNRNIFFYRNDGTAGSPYFTDQTNSEANPFSGLNLNSTGGGDPYNVISLADVDTDGDLDMISSCAGGTFAYYENTGTPEVASFSLIQVEKSILFEVTVPSRGTPTLADLNGDNLPDLVSGCKNGILYGWENTYDISLIETASRLSPVAKISVGKGSNPAVGDIDGDGDLDLLVGEEETGGLLYYQNTGTATQGIYVQQAGGDNPFDGFQPGAYLAAPVLADMDADGDLDLLAGSSMVGEISYWKNTGTVTVPAYTAQTGGDNPFDGISDNSSLDALINPLVADIDDDGDLDLVYTNERGNQVFFYRNTGTAAVPVFADQTGTASDPFKDITLTERVAGSPYQALALGDLDKDGDLDLITGNAAGKFYYYRNTGTAAAAVFEKMSDSHDPVKALSVKDYATPVCADINGDGWLDLISGCGNGKIYLYLQNRNFFYFK